MDNNPLALFPLVYTFIVVPIADAIFGEDRHSPPKNRAAAGFPS